MTEAAALHVVVSDFGDQFGTERLPGQILAPAPAALGARHAMLGVTVLSCLLGPMFPRVSSKRVLTVRREEFYQFASLLFREARADADVLQRAGVIEKAEQERADHCTLTVLMPAKTGNDTVTVALVLDLEHHALIRFVGSQNRFSDDAVETGAFEAAKPVRRNAQFASCGCQVEWRRYG